MDYTKYPRKYTEKLDMTILIYQIIYKRCVVDCAILAIVQ